MIASLSELARRARTVLAEPECATLLVRGIGPIATAGPAVLLHEDRGRPRFLCEPGAPLQAPARAGADALLRLSRHAEERLLLAGALALLGAEQVDGERIDVIGLEPSSVVIQTPAQRHDIPLPLYLADAPIGTELAEHLNACHQPELRRHVAQHVGVAPRTIAGVRIGCPLPSGVELGWVDETGAHSVRLRSPQAGYDQRDWARQLRQLLADSAADADAGP